MSEKNPAVRLEICKSCPYIQKPFLKCKKCGCAMKSKVLNSNAKCPVGKW